MVTREPCLGSRHFPLTYKETSRIKASESSIVERIKLIETQPVPERRLDIRAMLNSIVHYTKTYDIVLSKTQIDYIELMLATFSGFLLTQIKAHITNKGT